MEKFRFLFLILTFAFSGLQTAQAEAVPDIYGQYGVAIDAATGEILYDKSAREKAYPASLTKVMTAILLEEHVEDGEWIEISKNAQEQEASNGYFHVKEGEKLTKEDALHAIMLVSSNDVSMAIAEHISGDAESFAELMNQKAKEIGAKDTHFVTPNGLHHDEHVTTAYDMALIARESLKYPKVVQVMGTKKWTVTVHSSEEAEDPRQVDITNPSKIHDNPLAIGGKTGYTSRAQNTLMEILQKDNKRIIAVVMQTTLSKEYEDIEIMGDYAFDRIVSEEVIKRGDAVKEVAIGDEKITIFSKENFIMTYKKGERPEIDFEIMLDETLLSEGVVSGKAEILKNGQIERTLDVYSDQTISPPAKKSWNPGVISAVFGMTVVLYVGYAILHNYKRRKNKFL